MCSSFDCGFVSRDTEGPNNPPAPHHTACPALRRTGRFPTAQLAAKVFLSRQKPAGLSSESDGTENMWLFTRIPASSTELV
ncbi:hypothetical protein E2C01_090983 [Portunus trituberculatus]|uniref:Uncharacterized protein n=1 Tax=Portunus trituberculatus TaxID=210409 RepID=A0A5B7JRK6_PORTR|nr:hypothetical protein [Portunus trituberculatus]